MTGFGVTRCSRPERNGGLRFADPPYEFCADERSPRAHPAATVPLGPRQLFDHRTSRQGVWTMSHYSCGRRDRVV